MNGHARQGTVGILPVGSLGVGFFFHLTRGLDLIDGTARFIERSGSPSGQALGGEGTLCIANQGGLHRGPTEGSCPPDWRACAKSGWLTEIVLFCTQSDRILPVITNFVELLERLHAAEGLDAAVSRLALIVLCSHRIYHLRG